MATYPPTIPNLPQIFNPEEFYKVQSGVGSLSEVLAVGNDATNQAITNGGAFGCSALTTPFGYIDSLDASLLGDIATSGLSINPDGTLKIKGATAKGSLLVGDGTNTTQLPTSTNGLFLKTNSATSSGLEWGSAGGGATTIDITDTDTSATFYPTFVSGAGTSQTLRADVATTPFSYNPSTSTLTATTFSGGLSGNATSSSTSTNITTTTDNTSGTYYIPFSKTTAGTSTAMYLDDTTTALTYNPSTSSLSSVQYVASASGSTNTLGSSSMAISNAGGSLTLNQGSLTASTTFAINSTSGQVINLQTNGTNQSSITANGVQISLLTTQGTATYSSPTLALSTSASAPYPTLYTNLITFSGSAAAQTISAITPPTNMPVNAMYMVYITNSNTSAGAITINATSLGSGIKTTYTAAVVIPISGFALGTLTKVGSGTYIWSVNLVA
jgi:hypothetical protein